MRKKIVQDSLDLLLEKPKFVRIALAGSFFHTLGTVGYLAYTINNAMVQRLEAGIPVGDLAFLVISWVNDHNLYAILIPLVLLVLLGYGLFYPIGDAAMYSFVSGRTARISRSLAFGLEKFFGMFEFHLLKTTFSLMTFFVILLRIWMLGIEGMLGVQIVLVIWFLVVLTTSVMWAYAKIFISLKNYDFFDALRKSGEMAVRHLGPTMKLMAREILLSLRFFVVTAVVLGLPLGILFLAQGLGILSVVSVGFMIWLVFVLLLLASYINAMVEAFFVSYWYRAWEKFSAEDAAEEAHNLE